MELHRGLTAHLLPIEGLRAGDPRGYEYSHDTHATHRPYGPPLPVARSA